MRILLKVRLERSKRCSLYSTGPSCGSASSRVIAFVGLKDDALLGESLVSDSGASKVGLLETSLVHGDDTRGISVSKVKMEAMFNWSSDMTSLIDSLEDAFARSVPDVKLMLMILQQSQVKYGSDLDNVHSMAASGYGS